MALPASDVMSARSIALSLSERDFQRKVIDRAVWSGWRVFHPLPAKTSKGWRTSGQGTPEGFVDLVLARNGRVLHVELKSEKGRLTDAQRDWLDHLGGYVWRPSDWERVCAVLDEEIPESSEGAGAAQSLAATKDYGPAPSDQSKGGN